MRSNLSRVVLIAMCCAAFAVAGALPASAHEHRQIGRWSFEVGWGSEPAYTGALNSVALLLTGPGGKPVNDLGDSLKVEVILGSDKVSLSLEPNFEVGEFGTQGDYRAAILPTRPGAYTFHFTGTIKGDAIDASFTSSDTTFDSIKDSTEIQFPARDPSTAQLKDRLDREFPRIERRTAALDDDVSNAKTVGYAGVGAGGLGVILALIAIAIATRRRARAASA